jgi:hypothetical protein
MISAFYCRKLEVGQDWKQGRRIIIENAGLHGRNIGWKLCPVPHIKQPNIALPR